jgi:hypothetical protein
MSETQTIATEKAPKAKIATVTDAEGVLTFSFTNGKVHTFDVNAAPTELIARLAMHGAEQKLRDSYAGKGTDPEVARGFFLKVLDNLNAGVFTAARTGEPREEPTALLARAVVAALGKAGKNKTVEEVTAVLEGMDKAGRAAWRRNPEIAAELAAIRAQAGKPTDLASIADVF